MGVHIDKSVLSLFPQLECLLEAPGGRGQGEVIHSAVLLATLGRSLFCHWLHLGTTSNRQSWVLFSLTGAQLFLVFMSCL
jgi:hypothetical protein